ncbi:hypothetical protein AB0K25_26880 [Micromonospora sp. NPDC049257]|uniref:hypothetical protein n=1 Tax=Micromonospora sp. NPDC049257 TaxID=3155771 RepID=UPI003417E890
MRAAATVPPPGRAGRRDFRRRAAGSSGRMVVGRRGRRDFRRRAGMVVGPGCSSGKAGAPGVGVGYRDDMRI